MALRGHIWCRQVRPASARFCRGSRMDGRHTTTTPGAVTPLGYAAYPANQAPYPVQTQYVTERAVAQRRCVEFDAADVSSEVKPRRTWQKSALLIGGSAGTGAGLGASIGGKKGALAGAAIGGGAAAIYDQVKRH